MGKIDELTNEASAMQKPVSDIAERGGSGAIAQLIQQYCPDGVEYVNVGDVCDIHKGVQFNKSDMKEMGSYPVMNGGINPSGYAEVFNEDDNTITISQGGASAGYVNFLDSKFWLGAHCYALKPYSVVMNRYLYHYIKQNEITLQQCQYGAGIPALAKRTISSLEIPLPPLPVQEAIVNILDRFAVYAAELQEELQEELQARQQQYNYYRDTLLSFEGREDVQWMKLGEVCDNLDRKRKPITASNRIAGVIPYYGASGIVDYVKDYIFDGDYLLVSEDGANLLTRTYPIAFSIHGKTWVNNHAHILQFEERATRKYVEYYLNSIDLSLWISAGAQPKLTQDNLNKIPIPVPSLSEQQRIVDILDRFDTLVNDLSQGLPAEIEARQQQYEYYRDKLLTFKKKEA